MGTPPPGLLARARVFTIAFAVMAVIGLAIGVVVPLVVPGPKPLTIALGSACFVLILIAGGKLLRRVVMRGASPGS